MFLYASNVVVLASGVDRLCEMIRERELDSFVARIWMERGSNGEPLWRGHVRHVQGDQEAYFQNLKEMGEFLERVSGVPCPAATVRAGKSKKRGDKPKAAAPRGRKR